MFRDNTDYVVVINVSIKLLIEIYSHQTLFLYLLRFLFYCTVQEQKIGFQSTSILNIYIFYSFFNQIITHDKLIIKYNCEKLRLYKCYIKIICLILVFVQVTMNFVTYLFELDRKTACLRVQKKLLIILYLGYKVKRNHNRRIYNL